MRSRLALPIALALALPLFACASAETSTPSSTAGEGGSGQGGATSTGGSGQGGATATGGAGQGGATATGGAGQGGATSTGGAGQGGAGPGGGGQGGANPHRFDCNGEKAVSAAGVADTGFRACDNGVMHRPIAVACGSLVPRAAACDPGPGGAPGDCVHDADCAAPYGHCSPQYVGMGMSKCTCQPGCVEDSDCPSPDEICLCGDPIGRCVPAACATDADCAGAYCRSFAMGASCPGGVAFKCESPADGCVTDEGCGNNELCSIKQDGVAACVGICMD